MKILGLWKINNIGYSGSGATRYSNITATFATRQYVNGSFAQFPGAFKCCIGARNDVVVQGCFPKYTQRSLGCAAL